MAAADEHERTSTPLPHDAAGGADGAQSEAASEPRNDAKNQQRLDVQLTGALPCVVCGYNLQGLTIRGECPECGSLVRATILYRVDPKAEEFARLYSAKAVAAGLVLWIGGALLLSLAGWGRRAGEWIDSLTLHSEPRIWLGIIALVSVLVSMLGAIALIRPTRETKPWKSIAAILGVLAYGPMLWAVSQLVRMDALARVDLFATSTMPQREIARLVLAGAIIVVCLSLRGIARDLAKRSLALRTGRVDRQTLLSIALAASVGAMGDTIRLWTAVGPHDMNQTAALISNAIGGAIVLVSAVFITLGLCSAMIDACRIARVIWRPGPSMTQLIAPPAPPHPPSPSAPHAPHHPPASPPHQAP